MWLILPVLAPCRWPSEENETFWTSQVGNICSNQNQNEEERSVCGPVETINLKAFISKSHFVVLRYMKWHRNCSVFEFCKWTSVDKSFSWFWSHCNSHEKVGGWQWQIKALHQENIRLYHKLYSCWAGAASKVYYGPSMLLSIIYTAR